MLCVCVCVIVCVYVCVCVCVRYLVCVCRVYVFACAATRMRSTHRTRSSSVRGPSVIYNTHSLPIPKDWGSAISQGRAYWALPTHIKTRFWSTSFPADVPLQHTSGARCEETRFASLAASFKQQVETRRARGHLGCKATGQSRPRQRTGRLYQAGLV